MSARRRPTAVFCANDLIAVGLLQQLTQQGVAVPDDIAIIGYDDIEYAAAAAVPLSSVAQPRHELGQAAARLLIEEAEQGPASTPTEQVVFTPELVARASTAVRRLTARHRARHRTRPPARSPLLDTTGRLPYVSSEAFQKRRGIREGDRLSQTAELAHVRSAVLVARR